MNTICAANIFPHNSDNKFFEEGSPAIRRGIQRAESYIVKIASAFPTALLGAYALKEAKIELIPTDPIREYARFGLIASVAILAVGFLVTRTTLKQLNAGPKLDSSNSLSKDQVKDWLGRMEKVAAVQKISPDDADRINEMIKEFKKEPNQERFYFNQNARRHVKTFLQKFEKFEKDLVGNTISKHEIECILGFVNLWQSDFAYQMLAQAEKRKKEHCAKLKEETPAEVDSKINELLNQLRIRNRTFSIPYTKEESKNLTRFNSYKFTLEKILGQFSADAKNDTEILLTKEEKELLQKCDQAIKEETPKLNESVALTQILYDLWENKKSFDEILAGNGKALNVTTDELNQWQQRVQKEVIQNKKGDLENNLIKVIYDILENRTKQAPSNNNNNNNNEEI